MTETQIVTRKKLILDKTKKNYNCDKTCKQKTQKFQKLNFLKLKNSNSDNSISDIT